MIDSGTSSKQRILFIVNPISGFGHKGQVGKGIEAQLDHTRFSYEILYTEEKGHAVVLARKAAKEGVSIVAAVGGDGTVNEVGQGLVGTGCALAIIPSGSGNGLARHLRVPLNLPGAMKVINRAKRMRIDTVTLNGSLFLNMAGIGFDAHVARKFERSGRRGFFSYLRIVISSYRSYKPKKYSITVDGTRIRRKALMISFANSSQFGNKTTIAPHASVNDGYVEVCIMKKLPFWKVILMSPLVFLGKTDKMPSLEIVRAREVTVKRKKGRYLHLDGDPEKGKKLVSVVVQPLSLQVIVP